MTDAGTDGAKGWEKYGMPDDVKRFQVVGKEFAGLLRAFDERDEASYLRLPGGTESASFAESLETGEKTLRNIDASFQERIRTMDKFWSDRWGLWGRLDGDEAVFWDFGYASDPPGWERGGVAPKVDHGPFETWITTNGDMSDGELVETTGVPLESMFRFDWLTQWFRALNLCTTLIGWPGLCWYGLNANFGAGLGWIAPVRWTEGSAESPGNTLLFTRSIGGRWYEANDDPTIEPLGKNPATGESIGLYAPNGSYPAGTVIRAKYEVVAPGDVLKGAIDAPEAYFPIGANGCRQVEFDPLGTDLSEGGIVAIEHEIASDSVNEGILLLDLSGSGGAYVPEAWSPPGHEELYSDVYGFGLRCHYVVYDFSKAFEFVEPEDSGESA